MMTTKLGLYVHVPFCAQKCEYCNFYSIPHVLAQQEEWVSAVLQEMAQVPHKNADTLYFGGGTPTLVPPCCLARIVSLARQSFRLDLDCAEITMEANPETVNLAQLEQYRAIGINRISFGVQSAQNCELQALGRRHTFSQAKEAIAQAKQAGFSNLSVDLMLGIPYQTEQSLADTLEKFGALEVTHVSAYLLKVEQNTPLAESPLLSHCAGEDEAADLYLQAVETLEQMGLHQYEISNFAKAGFSCKHNLKYWNCGEYLGFGPAAHSFYDGMRYGHSLSFKTYCQSPTRDRLQLERAPNYEQERLMLGLRLKAGVACKTVPNQPFIKELEFHGLASCKEGRISLTPRGMLLSNSIILKLQES